MMAIVQSGWLDITQAEDSILYSWDDQYAIEMSDSQNNHVGRDGTVTGAKVSLASSANIRGIGIAILRRTTGTNYTIVGKSQEKTTGLSDGINTIVFDTPIENVLSTDIIALIISGKGDTTYDYYTNTAKFPINDSATAKVRWHLSGSAFYSTYAVDTTYGITAGGTVFGVMCICAMMDSPKVVIVGDSIAEGGQINFSYRNNATIKDRLGAYAANAYRTLNWSCENAANTQTSNNAHETLTYDLAESGNIQLWRDKQPQYLHLHTGVNDVYDFMSQGANWYGTEITAPNEPIAVEIVLSGTEYLAKLDAILVKCRANNCKLIISAIFPWTGDAANNSGKHTQNTVRDAWNLRLAAWAAGKDDVYLCNINSSLGQARTVAKSGDPTPTAGNLWDLVPDYTQDDGNGVHISLAGCAVAATALATVLGLLLNPPASVTNAQYTSTRNDQYGSGRNVLSSVNDQYSGTENDLYNV